MERQNIRREPRIAQELEVTLQTLTGQTTFKTQNVSYQGVYIVCPEPYPLRKLVRFKTILPNNDSIQMLGLVAHTLNFADASLQDRPPGMGIQLYSLGKDAKEKWREFVRSHYERLPETQVVLKKLEYARLPLPFGNLKQLKSFVENDLSSERAFIPTSSLFSVGEKLWCDMLHPLSGAKFSLEAKVLEVVEKPSKEQGLWLTFSPIDDVSKLQDFLGTK